MSRKEADAPKRSGLQSFDEVSHGGLTVEVRKSEVESGSWPEGMAMLDGTPVVSDDGGTDRHIHRPLARRRGSSEKEVNLTNIHHTRNYSQGHIQQSLQQRQKQPQIFNSSDRKLGIFPSRTFNLNKLPTLLPQLRPFLGIKCAKGEDTHLLSLGGRSLSLLDLLWPSRDHSRPSFARVLDLERGARTGASASSRAGQRLVKILRENRKDDRIDESKR